MARYEYNHPGDRNTPTSADVRDKLDDEGISLESVIEDNRMNRTIIKTSEELDDEQKEKVDELIEELVQKAN